MKSRAGSVYFLVGVAALAVATAAQAQTAPVEQNAAAQPGTPVQDHANTRAQVDDIVVTARRRSENIQSVPISIVALSQQALRENVVSEARDLARVAPGLVAVAGSGNPTLTDFSIRGRGLNFGAAAGSVETYFAEVPLSAPFQMPQLPAQFFDLASVQVLKGPQGTLFGRSTTGGAVLLQPNLPSDEFEGYARGQIGNYDNLQFEGAINVPVAPDLLAVRVAGFFWQRDGYARTSATIPADAMALYAASPAAVTRQFGNGATYAAGNILNAERRVIVRNGTILEGDTGEPVTPTRYNRQDTQEVRVSARLTPSDAITNDTIFTYHRDENNGTTTGSLLVVRNATGAVIGSEPGLGTGTYTAYLSSARLRPRSQSYAVVNTTAVDLADTLRLKNIFGYIHSSGYALAPNDSDGGPGRIIDGYTPSRKLKNTQYTNELQLQGNLLDNRLEFTVGGLIDRIKEPRNPDRLNIASVASVAGSPLVDPAAPSAQPRLERQLSTDISSDSLYGALTFRITDQLSVSGGYRHIWDDVDALQASVLFASRTAPGVFQDANPDIAGTQQTRRLRAKFEGDVYSAGIDYKLSSDVLLYGTYRRGFKRGGFNSSAFGSFPAGFGPETVDAFALGAKTTFYVGTARTRFNLEAYRDNYKGYQASYLQFAAGSLLTLTANIPKTRYQGFDAELGVDFARFLDVSVNYAYLDAEIRRFPDTTLPGVNPGLEVNKIPYASKHQIQASARLHGEIGDLGEFVLRPSLSYRSKNYTTFFNRRLPAAQAAVFGPFDNIAIGGGTIEGVKLVDLRAEWNRIAGSKFSAAVGATNLFDKYYTIGNTGTLSFGNQGFTVGPPRMVYGEVTVRF